MSFSDDKELAFRSQELAFQNETAGPHDGVAAHGGAHAALGKGFISSASNLEIIPLTWGFALGESKRLVFNTRIESALGGSPLWKRAIQEGRCIMPVASFFEPHGSETVRSPRTGKPMKRQYEFADADNQPLLLAGVHDQGRLSIVTTSPNASVAPIHERMPLALRFEEVPVWLEGDFAALADRADFGLIARPEDADTAEAGNTQLTLF
jgi:putative SOS response-associated peptidase YedK